MAVVNYILSHLNGDQRPYLEVSILGIKLCGLLDSGASLSILGQHGWDSLKQLNLPLDPADNPQCRVANGKVCTSLGSVTLPVRLIDRIKLIRFVVVPDISSSLILGMDFWRAMEIVPDLNRDEWKFSALAPVSNEDGMRSQSELTTEQRQHLEHFLDDQWKRMDTSLGCTTLVQHTITTDSLPIKQRYYPVSPAMQKHIHAELDNMLKEGIIEPSQSPWSSPILMVPKKDGTFRFCVDYRRLNKVTKKDAYPLPYVSAILDRLRGAKYLSSLDIKSAYWQIPVDEASRDYTAFTVPGRGLFQFKRMPFGLTNAPATWQRLIDRVLGPDLEPHVFVYLDDIIIISEDFDQHLDILQKIFDRLATANLTLSRDKCQFCRSELRYLGYIVDKQGLRVDPDKVSAILNIPTPHTVSELRRFLGMASWYRRFIQDFSTLSSPLTDLLRKNRKWQWTENCQQAFQRLKECLVSAPILTCPDFEQPFVVQTDASAYGLGAVLTQTHQGKEQVICFLSRSLTKQERNYSTTERECLAVIWALEKLRPYLEGTRFTVITDHHSLLWLNNLKDPAGRLCRWAVRLQQHDFDIIHRKGKDHLVPDCLSRSVGVTDAVGPSSQESVNPTTDRWYTALIEKISSKPRKYPLWRIENGVLFKYTGAKIPELDGSQYAWKQVVPKDKRLELLQQAHDEPTSGHPGVTKTYAKLRQKFYWPKMKADVAAYVRRCVTCTEHKAIQQRPPGLMGTRPRVFRPFQMISTDLIGPLPNSSRGYKYILVVADYFSKFVVTCPLRAATAPAVTRFLENDVFLLFGVPQYLICDNGVQYQSTEFRQLCRKYNVNILFNALYHPQNNPSERVNRVVKTMLASYVKDNHRHWDIYLPAVSCAIRTLVHEVTGYTPYYINFGREHMLSGNEYPVDAFAPHEPVDYDRDNLQKRVKGFTNMYADVRKRLDRAYQQSSAQYNLRRRPVEYDVGQRVWRRNFALSKAVDHFASKLARKYIGPFIIRRKISSTSYELGDHNGKERGIWHVKDLKPGPDGHADDDGNA